MVARQRKRRTTQRELHFARNLTNTKFNYNDPKTVIKNALVYMSMLRLKIESAKREYEYLKTVKRQALNQIKNSNEFEEVKVEKIGERFLLKVTSPRGGHMLVHILEALEEMGLNVFQARVSCQNSFAMEAIVVPQGQEKEWSVDDVTQTLVKALGKPSG